MEEGRNGKREIEGRKRKRGERRGKKGGRRETGERKERWKKMRRGRRGRKAERKKGGKKEEAIRASVLPYASVTLLYHIISYRIISYQITARRLFSVLPANSCLSLYYAQHYSLGVLRKLTWLVFVSYLMQHIYYISNVYLEGF